MFQKGQLSWTHLFVEKDGQSVDPLATSILTDATSVEALDCHRGEGIVIPETEFDSKTNFSERINRGNFIRFLAGLHHNVAKLFAICCLEVF